MVRPANGGEAFPKAASTSGWLVWPRSSSHVGVAEDGPRRTLAAGSAPCGTSGTHCNTIQYEPDSQFKMPSKMPSQIWALDLLSVRLGSWLSVAVWESLVTFCPALPNSQCGKAISTAQVGDEKPCLLARRHLRGRLGVRFLCSECVRCTMGKLLAFARMQRQGGQLRAA